MANENRIYYASQNTAIAGPYAKGGTAPSYTGLQGIQSVGMNTNFNLEPIYQLGQLGLYDNYEEIPEVEITLNKVLDGRATIYQKAMGAGGLSALSTNVCNFQLHLYAESGGSTSIATVTCAPSYLSSVTYTFPSEGNATEEVTLVSNDKSWSPSGVTSPTLSSAPATINGNPGIIRRGLIKTLTIPTTANDGGLSGSLSGGIPAGMKVQSMTISMNLGRESIYQLGSRAPYYRYINFPVEVTCEIECVAGDGDRAGVSEGGGACSNPKALKNKSIAIELCDGMKIDLGSSNKLTSVNYTGGDTGGGNATVTYSYQTFNDFSFTPPSGT